jgi:hypothetical protein
VFEVEGWGFYQEEFHKIHKKNHQLRFQSHISDNYLS